MGKYKHERIDSDFESDMRQLSAIRVANGLAKPKANEMSIREMTNLLRRTEGYKISIEELKRKQKK